MLVNNWENMPIDYVIPFVDYSDEKWFVEYKKYVSSLSDWSNNATRFRDWDILRYQLRSIERYMSWIRNIFIVMSISETQVPKCLNIQHKIVTFYGTEPLPNKKIAQKICQYINYVFITEKCVNTQKSK